MDVAYITALSALAGSVVGGLTTGITTWLSSRSQARAGLLTAELVRRQDLFRDFIIAASKTYGDALVSNEPKIQELVALYAMVSRMRVLCAPETVACADKVLRMTIDTYLGPNRTIPEMRELMASGAAVDPLREFSEVAREEMENFTRL
ncbi:MAG: hypothetical protein ACLQJR_29635 [Stellaceae bacterium]